MVIGNVDRRKIVQANQQMRKSNQTAVLNKKPMPQRHARNHSELLSAQFKNEGILMTFDQNDKFNVDGDVANMTSSESERFYENAKPSHLQDVINQPEDTSIGDFEVDEDTGDDFQPL